jgi:NAD(P)-dependent dehydrogenase (short-subunit alcohol dehydrogenase family)
MVQNSAIVNASSVAGLVGRETNGIHAANKHAVIGLTRTAAKDTGKRGVSVNVICP